MESEDFEKSGLLVEKDIKDIISKVVLNSNSYEEAYQVLIKDYKHLNLNSLEDELSKIIINAHLLGLKK